MSGVLYVEAKNSLLKGNWNWTSDSAYVALIGTGYSPNTAQGGDKTLANIPADAIIAISTAIQGKAVNFGTATASNLTVSALPAGTVENLVLFVKDTAGNSYLIALLSDLVGLPVSVAEQGALTIVWNSGSSGIFSL
jgi:hypothetical protein